MLTKLPPAKTEWKQLQNCKILLAVWWLRPLLLHNNVLQANYQTYHSDTSLLIRKGYYFARVDNCLKRSTLYSRRLRTIAALCFFRSPNYYTFLPCQLLHLFKCCKHLWILITICSRRAVNQLIRNLSWCLHCLKKFKPQQNMKLI